MHVCECVYVVTFECVQLFDGVLIYVCKYVYACLRLYGEMFLCIYLSFGESNNVETFKGRGNGSLRICIFCMEVV